MYKLRACSSGVNLAGIMGTQGQIQKAWFGGDGKAWGGGTPPSGDGSGRSPSFEKFEFSLKWRVLVYSQQYFCPCPRQKKDVDIST